MKKYLVLLVLVSCQKELHPPTNSLGGVFDDYWNQMNRNYVFWDIDSTNWNDTYDKYKPLFLKLNKDKQADLNTAVDYFKEITINLKDSHYMMIFQSPGITNFSINPALSRKIKSKSYHKQFSYTQLDTFKYIDNGFKLGLFSKNGSGNSTTVICGHINNNILYFSCSAFYLEKAYTSSSYNSAKSVLSFYENQLTELGKSLKGLIIDLRGNEGGELSDLNFFVGRFIVDPLHFGYTKYKNNNGKYDFTPWVSSYILPVVGSKKITSPIILLTDNFSASLSEAVAMSLHVLPNVRIVGETTYGATSPIVDRSIYNSGPFSVANFLYVQESSVAFKYIDDKIYEGIGFPPDFYIPFDENQVRLGIDNQIEKAISLIF